MRIRFLPNLALISCGALLATTASAQAPADPEAGPTMKGEIVAPEATEEDKRKEGWTPGIAIGGSFNLVDNRAVVGQTDGTTITLGGGVDAILEFNKEIHEWRNTLVANAGVTRTPSIDEFIKTNDGLAFESIYLMHLLEVFGPFARFGLNTQMFPTTDVRAAPADYVVSNTDGTTSNFTGRRLHLTEPFEPLTLRESLGVFYQPIRSDAVSLEGRLGLGALETFASGLAITDDAATPGVEVTGLDDSYMIGGEGVLNIWGFFDEGKRVSYTAGIGVLVPFATSSLAAGDERGLGDLVNLEGNAGLNAKLFDWAALSYRFHVTRQPLLVDEYQITNSLLITIGAAFGSKAPVPEPPPPTCEPILLPPKSGDGSAEGPTPAPAEPVQPAPAPVAPAPAPAPADPAPVPPPADPEPEPEPEPTP